MTAMRTRYLASIALLVAFVAVGLVAPASGQAPRKYNVPKTPWGDPDLQGVWNDATSTPLQRPANAGEKPVLSDEEAEEFQKSLAFDLTRDRRDGGNAADVNRAYNEHWMDARRLKITADRAHVAHRRSGRRTDSDARHAAARAPEGASLACRSSGAVRGRVAGRLH